MKIADREWLKCARPEALLTGVRHEQTDYGPADFFADLTGRKVYVRVWLNRHGVSEIVWYELRDG